MLSESSSHTEKKIKKLRVLLVDDSATVRQELRQLLELTGEILIVGEAGDGLQAIFLTREHNPDVVIMDLEMPVMNGYEATLRLKALPNRPRVVILSAYAHEMEQNALGFKADGIIVKGTDYQTLLSIILGQGDKLNSIK